MSDTAKKALVVWGGWLGHEPKQCADIFAPFLRSKGYDVTVSDTLDVYLNKELMDSLDLIVPAWTMGTITGDQEKALLAAIKNGVGIGGWHGGMGDSFRNNTEYQFMVGGQWVAHPGGVIDYRVNITRPDDPGRGPRTSICTLSGTIASRSINELCATTFGGEICPWIEARSCGGVEACLWQSRLLCLPGPHAKT